MRKKSLAILLIITLCLGICFNVGCSVSFGTTKDNELSSEVKKRSYASGDEVTVEKLKDKYGEEKTSGNKVQPLYSIKKNEPFVFTFPYKLGTIPMEKVASIHSDIECKDESRIITNYNLENTPEGKSKITINPSSCIIKNEQTEKEDKKSKEESWGNLGIYYLKISYDNTTSEPKELEEPTIIPFTIKSSIDTPNVIGKTNNKGVLTLSWNKIENAIKYNIYQNRGSIENYGKKGVHGAKTGYGKFPSCDLVTSTTETSCNNLVSDKYNTSKNTKEGLDIFGDYCQFQNMEIGGEYYVTAVDKDGNESNFSQGVDAYDYKDTLPQQLKEAPDSYKAYESIDELPKMAEVKMVDETIKTYPITYKLNESQNATTGNDIVYDYTLAGTGFFAKVKVKNGPINDAPKDINKDPNGKPNVEQEKDGVDNIPGNPEGDGASGNVDEQRDKTKSDVEEGNKDSLKLEDGAYVNADSSAEEWLALNMINGEEKISIKGYPELSSGERLNDILSKVFYQNPYITNVESMKFNYESNELIIKYAHSKEDIKKMNSEITKEANKVLAETIKDGMSDEEKVEAIYDYLNDNTKYADEVLEEAEKNNYELPPGKYAEAFETYGILCQKKGVCQSYGYVVRLLCDMAGVECVHVIGDTTDCGHAWNKVKLDDKWYNLDCTNSETNVGIKKLFYLNTDQTMENAGTFQNNEYCLDEDLTKYDAKDDDKEYYAKNGLCAKNTKEYSDILDKHFDDGDNITIRYTDINNIKQEEIQKSVTDICKKHNHSGTIQLANLGEYIVFSKNVKE